MILCCVLLVWWPLLLATVVEGDQKAPFSIATTVRGKKGATLSAGFLHFTLDTYLIMLSVKQGSIKYNFLSLWYDSTWDWTLVSRTTGEHSTHYADKNYIYIYISYNVWKHVWYHALISRQPGVITQFR